MEDGFNDKKKQKMSTTTLILTIILVLLLVYVIYDLVTGMFDKREESVRESIFSDIEQGIQNCSVHRIKDGQIALVDVNCANQMYSQGYATAFSDIIDAATGCKIVPLNFNNQTMEIVDVSCIQQETTETPIE